MNQPLLQDINEGVLATTFDNPEKKNAFNTVAWLALAEALFSGAK